MESAEQKTQIIELSTNVRRQEHYGPAALDFAKHRRPARDIDDSYDIIRRQSENEIQAKGKKVGKAQIINRLNYINFQDGAILANFNHPKYDKIIPSKPCRNPVGET